MTSLSIETRAKRFLAMLRHCQVLGLTVDGAGPDSVTMRLPYAQQIVGNPVMGTVHGGSLTTLMDTACGTAVFSILPDFELCPTLDLRMDYMKPAASGLDLVAVAKATRIASSVVFTECEVYQEEGGERGDLIAKCAATFMRIGASMTPPEFRAKIEFGDDA